MGEGKSLCVFGKCFTKFSKVKYFTTFYKEFYGQRKIFYKFDYILPANKHLKIEKYFTSKQTKCAFRYHLFCWKLKIENNKKIISNYYSQIFFFFFIYFNALFIGRRHHGAKCSIILNWGQAHHWDRRIKITNRYRMDSSLSPCTWGWTLVNYSRY